MGDDIYELKDEELARPVKSARAKAEVRAVMPLGYEGKKVGGEGLEEKVRDFYAPLWLLAGGIVVEFGAHWLLSLKFGGAGAAGGMGGVMGLLHSVGVGMGMGTVVMLLGVMLAAKLKGLSLGLFWTVVLKLVALSIAPVAVRSALLLPLHLVPFGGILAWGVSFVAYYVLLGFLFELDGEDTWFLVVVIFMVQLAALAAAIYLG